MPNETAAVSELNAAYLDAMVRGDADWFERRLAADFVGIKVPNRYVFGFGLDVKGAWRNLPAIYAVNSDS